MLAKLFETKLLVDMVLVIFGFYMLFVSMKMKKTGKIHPIFLAEEDLKKCKNNHIFMFDVYDNAEYKCSQCNEKFIKTRIVVHKQSY